MKNLKYSENYNRKYSGFDQQRKHSGFDQSRKVSVAASDISIITIDKIGYTEYDEGVNVNEVKSINNTKINPL